MPLEQRDLGTDSTWQSKNTLSPQRGRARACRARSPEGEGG